MRVMRKRARFDGRTGNAIIEFALVSTVSIPLLVGTVTVGHLLVRAIQVTQVSRDAGHMYARYVDFSLPANQELIVRLARGLGMSRTGGYGKVILSKVMKVGPEECAGAGLSLAECTNYNFPVILQRIVIGNANLRPSALGEPNPSLLDAQGNVTNYLREPSARAVNFDAILRLEPGELAYVSEAYFEAPWLRFPGFLDQTGVYARTIF